MIKKKAGIVSKTMKSAVDWSKKVRIAQPPEDWWLDEISKLLKEGAVLDIGCGSGRFAGVLSKNNDYLGIDINSSEIDEAKRLHPKQEFVCSDILTWYGWKKFDNIFSWVSLQHIPPPDIYELFKIMKKNSNNFIFCEVITPITSDYQWTHPYEEYFKLVKKIQVMSGLVELMQFRR